MRRPVWQRLGGITKDEGVGWGPIFDFRVLYGDEHDKPPENSAIDRYSNSLQQKSFSENLVSYRTEFRLIARGVLLASSPHGQLAS